MEYLSKQPTVVKLQNLLQGDLVENMEQIEAAAQDAVGVLSKLDGKRCRSRLHPGCSGLNWASLLTVGRFRFKSVGSDPIRAGRRRIIYPGLVCPGLLRIPWAPSADLRRARAAAAPAGGQLPVAWRESGRGRFTKGSSPSALLRRPPPNPRLTRTRKNGHLRRAACVDA